MAWMKRRQIGIIIVDLRHRLGHTQRAFSTLLGWGLSSLTRAEAGARPGLKSMVQLRDLARSSGLKDLEAELQVHVNARLEPAFPISCPEEGTYILLARRIYQNPERREAFLKFTEREVEMLRLENEIRKEHDEEPWAL